MLARTLTMLAAAALASAASAETDVRAADWKLLRRAAPDARKTFSVAMPLSNFETLDAELAAVSDPRNPRYGAWLSKEQVDAIIATPAEVVEEVFAWATSTGATCERLVTSLKCEGSVEAIEELLSAELSEYMHKDAKSTIIRVSAGATVPDRLTGKVTMVTGLTNFPVPRLGNKRLAADLAAVAAADYSIVPSTLETLYNVAGKDGSNSSTMAAAEFQAYPAPLAADSKAFATNVGISPWTYSKTIGPFSPGAAAESALDVQYLSAMGQGNQEWYYTQADWMYEFAQFLVNASAADVPAVISMSYAWWEGQQCTISPSVAPCAGGGSGTGPSYNFVSQVNAMFAAATVKGITLLAASGDSGAHGRTDPSCTHKIVRPDYPAASPYVTAVGATELENGVTGAAPEPICKSQLQCATGGYEIVASNKVLAMFSSGGGFSNVAPTPSWQASVVASYLKNTTAQPPAGDFNATGRGYPDVAALGHNYYIELGGQVSSVDGTSAATPVFSGLVASLNAWRISQSKPVLGYLNPLLYQVYAANPKAFNDVVQGDNTCTEDACPCPAGDGYYAAPGWDATTGLGTPNYELIKQTMTAMGL